MKIRKKTLLQITWRSFLFQAAFNFERMQNIGFAFCMLPALEELYSGEQLKVAVSRHLEFFNSHPYLSSTLIGASVHLEERIATGEIPEQRVQNFKKYMMGPTAAIGDNFFWSSWKPFAATCALVTLFSGEFWAPILFLGIYNIVHLFFRFYGVFSGYKHGEAVIIKLNKLDLVRFAGISLTLSGVFIGISAAFLAQNADISPFSAGGIMGYLLFTFVVIILLMLLKKKLSVNKLAYLMLLFGSFVILTLGIFFPLI